MLFDASSFTFTYFLSTPVSLGTSFISVILSTAITADSSLQIESPLLVLNIFWSCPILKKKKKQLF